MSGDPAVPIDYNKQMTFDNDQPKKMPGRGRIHHQFRWILLPLLQIRNISTPSRVTVKRVDENGTEVRATYTPTVTGNPTVLGEDRSDRVRFKKAMLLSHHRS